MSNHTENCTVEAVRLSAKANPKVNRHTNVHTYMLTQFNPEGFYIIKKNEMLQLAGNASYSNKAAIR